MPKFKSRKQFVYLLLNKKAVWQKLRNEYGTGYPGNKHAKGPKRKSRRK